jgi:serine/threonine-protein phosphatase 2B catalytic subunit
MHRWDGP